MKCVQFGVNRQGPKAEGAAGSTLLTKTCFLTCEQLNVLPSSAFLHLLRGCVSSENKPSHHWIFTWCFLNWSFSLQPDRWNEKHHTESCWLPVVSLLLSVSPRRTTYVWVLTTYGSYEGNLLPSGESQTCQWWPWVTRKEVTLWIMSIASLWLPETKFVCSCWC